MNNGKTLETALMSLLGLAKYDISNQYNVIYVVDEGFFMHLILEDQ
jgi:hypothetical protein